MSEEFTKNELNEKDLEQVNGGKMSVVGQPSQYDNPEDVVFTFAGYNFVRVDAKMKRTKINYYEAALDARTGKYGARYNCTDNGGRIEWFWDDEISFTIL